MQTNSLYVTPALWENSLRFERHGSLKHTSAALKASYHIVWNVEMKSDVEKGSKVESTFITVVQEGAHRAIYKWESLDLAMRTLSAFF